MILKVNNDSLASVMILDRGLEVYPEPYRGQSDITLVVSFTQYTKFIEKYLEVTDYLATPSIVLRSKLALCDYEALQRAFYKDMACSVMKELWYAQRGSQPTEIVHTMEDTPVYNQEYVDVFCNAFGPEVEHAKDDMLSLLERCGYEYSVGILNKQRNVVKYASLLFAMSSPSAEYGVDFVKWSMTEGDR